jgi:hypothetical protein
MKLFILCLALAGCYDNPPPAIPRPVVPQVVPGAVLDVDSHEASELRPVTSHDRVCVGADCSTVSVTNHEYVTVKHAKATYNGQRLAFGQAQALADPTYLADYDRMTALAASCSHATVAKWVGELFTTGGILLLADGAGANSDWGSPYAIAGMATIAGGIAAYALGKYALGGQDCEPANDIFEARRRQWREVDSADVEDDLADELERIATQFNARAR